jgi:phosphoribosyl-dephospho-CoA transferase
MESLARSGNPVARLPASLRRQQLLHLSAPGWMHVLEAPWDATARSCLGLWAARGLPLVVTRQPALHDTMLATGLPAPARYRRRRLALVVAPQDVLYFDEFPVADAVARLLPRPVVASWRCLLAMLAATDCTPRVYGGYGWQTLTRLAYVHPDSDLDLLLPVIDATHADAVVNAVGRAAWTGPRLDGELLFPDGAAIAWREWRDYRQGRAAQVLVKRLRGVALETPGASPA